MLVTIVSSLILLPKVQIENHHQYLRPKYGFQDQYHLICREIHRKIVAHCAIRSIAAGHHHESLMAQELFWVKVL